MQPYILINIVLLAANLPLTVGAAYFSMAGLVAANKNTVRVRLIKMLLLDYLPDSLFMSYVRYSALSGLSAKWYVMISTIKSCGFSSDSLTLTICLTSAWFSFALVLPSSICLIAYIIC